MVTDPVAGDILVKKRKHVGLVTGTVIEVKGEMIVPSIEGNTFIGKPKKLDGVYKITKQKYSECTFIRL